MFFKCPHRRCLRIPSLALLLSDDGILLRPVAMRRRALRKDVRIQSEETIVARKTLDPARAFVVPYRWLKSLLDSLRCNRSSHQATTRSQVDPCYSRPSYYWAAYLVTYLSSAIIFLVILVGQHKVTYAMNFIHAIFSPLQGFCLGSGHLC